MTNDLNDRSAILRNVSSYYTTKVERHGTTPAGVDWNSLESQLLRFDQLLQIVSDGHTGFSMADLGCGYGHLYDHLCKGSSDFTYRGYDLSEAMIERARDLHSLSENASFSVSDHPTDDADYAVASGIFNVKLDVDVQVWKNFVLDTIAVLDRSSARGFAFNCLTSYSDTDRMRPDLYYADPLEIFDHCKRRFSRNVALLHDYGLYEFTILVRKRDGTGMLR